MPDHSQSHATYPYGSPVPYSPHTPGPGPVQVFNNQPEQIHVRHTDSLLTPEQLIRKIALDLAVAYDRDHFVDKDDADSRLARLLAGAAVFSTFITDGLGEGNE